MRAGDVLGVSRRLRPRDGALAVVVLMALAGIGYFLVGHRSPPPAGQQAVPGTISTAPSVAASGPLAVWVGDTWLAGEGVGGADDGIAARASRAMGWSYLLDLQSASGWTQTAIAKTERGAVPLLGRITAAAAHRPRIVLLEGGTNDAAHAAAASSVRAAAMTTMVAAKKAVPAGVPVVVIGPQWPDAAVPQAVLEIRAAVEAAAVAERLPFIDPIGEHWVTGSRASGTSAGTGTAPAYTGTDGADPSAAGTSAYAADLARDLRAKDVQVTAG
jgi:hypothetical protein